MDIKTIMLENLSTVLIIMGILFVLWGGNVVVSLYHNIKDLKGRFDKRQFIDGCLKIACILIGTLMLTVGVTSLFIFADKTGIVIEGLSDELTVATIVGIYGVACVYYAGQIILTLKNILVHNDSKALESGEIDGLDI